MQDPQPFLLRPSTLVGLLFVALVVIGGLSYLGYAQKTTVLNLQSDLKSLEVRRATEMTASNAALEAASTTIAALSNELNLTAYELDELENDFKDEKRRNDNLAEDLEEQEKLAKLDEELLQKYSKVYFLNENYTPVDLKEIPSRHIMTGKDDQYFHDDAYDFLEDLIKDAERDDIELKVLSGYRSFDEQNELKGQFTQLYGNGANTFAADQGFSEHQLGTTVDFSDGILASSQVAFADTDAYQWLLKNAHKHGFVLSYPEGNDFYIFEPWHWRFVGEDLADDLHDDNANFYDLDQRDINKYLIKIFD